MCHDTRYAHLADFPLVSRSIFYPFCVCAYEALKSSFLSAKPSFLKEIPPMFFCGLGLDVNRAPNAGISVFFCTALALVLLMCIQNQRNDRSKSPKVIPPIFKDAADSINRLKRINSEDSSISQIAPTHANDVFAVIHAETRLRTFINYQRRSNCSLHSAYSNPGVVRYIKKIAVDNASEEFALEVVYGADVIHARINFFSSKNRAGNADSQVITTIPGPCDTSVQDQLALSASGLSCSFS